VVKFWREYIGDQSIESVGNKELSGYIEWRKSYYLTEAAGYAGCAGVIIRQQIAVCTENLIRID
jgi:hypothetical protein